MNVLDRIFARSCSSEEALNALISIHRVVDTQGFRIHQDLALNPNLTDLQISQLLIETGQLSRSGDTYSLPTAVLIACRIDLTYEHVWTILKSSNRMLRHAILNPRGDIWQVSCSLNDEMVEYLLSKKWFSNSDPYIRAICNYKDKFGLTLKSFNLLKSVYNNRHPSDGLGLDGRVSAGLHPEVTWGKAYQKRNDLLWQIQSINSWDDYYTLNHQRQQPVFDEKFLSTLDLAIDTGRLNGKLIQVRLCLSVEEVTQGCEFEFYALFFKLLPDWRGSLNELIHSTKSLLDNT